MTYERIKYAALDARVSFEIAARSKELVAKPSPTKNENNNKKKNKNNKKKRLHQQQGIMDGWTISSLVKKYSLSMYIDIDGLFRWCAYLWNK